MPRYPQKVRLIGGRWKGRRIAVSDPLIRPTSDRIRETLFNWLMPHISGARCLDLFAGTGALGLEALSRGAAHITFIEKNKAIFDGIKNLLQTLNAAEAATGVQGDALIWLSQTGSTAPFDIVFVDPPFNQGMIEPVCKALAQGALLHPGSFVYIEGEKGRVFTSPVGWELIKSGMTQQITYRLYLCTSHLCA